MRKAICCCCSCKGVKNVCKSPFRLFIILTTGLNIPPIITAFFISKSSDVTKSCRGPIWLIINAVLSAINIIAAWYMCCKITRDDDSINSSIRNFRTVNSRATYMLMKDTWVAIFFTFWLLFIAWLCTGTAWIEQYSCPKFVTDCVAVSVGCGWAFLILGSLVFILTMCYAAFDNDTTYGGVKEGAKTDDTSVIPVAHIVEICEPLSQDVEVIATATNHNKNKKKVDISKASTSKQISKAQTAVIPSAPTMSFDMM